MNVADKLFKVPEIKIILTLGEIQTYFIPHKETFVMT